MAGPDEGRAAGERQWLSQDGARGGGRPTPSSVLDVATLKSWKSVTLTSCVGDVGHCDGVRPSLVTVLELVNWGPPGGSSLTPWPLGFARNHCPWALCVYLPCVSPPPPRLRLRPVLALASYHGPASSGRHVLCVPHCHRHHRCRCSDTPARVFQRHTPQHPGAGLTSYLS